MLIFWFSNWFHTTVKHTWYYNSLVKDEQKRCFRSVYRKQNEGFLVESRRNQWGQNLKFKIAIKTFNFAFSSMIATSQTRLSGSFSFFLYESFENLNNQQDQKKVLFEFFRHSKLGSESGNKSFNEQNHARKPESLENYYGKM